MDLFSCNALHEMMCRHVSYGAVKLINGDSCRINIFFTVYWETSLVCSHIVTHACGSNRLITA